MARRRSRFVRHDDGHDVGHINVTPLIDVVMCLIIFFLLVGRLASQNRPISLPETAVGESGEVPKLVIAVAPGASADATPEVSLAGDRVNVGELPELLKARLGEPPAGELAIRADRRLSWGQVRPVVEACRAAGLPTVKLITERADGGSDGVGGGVKP